MVLLWENKFLRFGIYVAFTLLCLLHQAKSDCSKLGCIDCHSWCESQKEYVCDNPAFQNVCRKTCQRCSTNAEVCTNLQCSHNCDLSEDGTSAVCTCPSGYLLNEDGRTCNDIDECAINGEELCRNSPKGSICYNLAGSYTCVTCNGVGGSKGIWNYYNRSECCSRNFEGTCGKSLTNRGKIIGGENAKIRSWPWMVYLKTFDNSCGGTLISKNYFVTAAHCVVNKNLDDITVYLGVEDITDSSNVHVQTRFVKKIHIHPEFNDPQNDIAVVTLNEPADFETDFVAPICLPNGEEPKVGEVCIAAGYGITSSYGEPSDVLKEVDLPVVDDDSCEKAYMDRPNAFNKTTQFCAGYEAGGKDTCKGDSGGPLMCQRCNNCDWYLAGLTSFGRMCARPGLYGVYVKIQSYEEWITSITNQPFHQRVCVATVWQEWGSWSQCSISCGVGSRTRTRVCLNGLVGDAGCIGRTSETVSCDAGTCAEWSPCSTTCGEGIQRRNSETRICIVQNLCPTWSDYGEWGACSLSCGGGMRKSVRQCLNGSPGDEGCLGSNERKESCNIQCCPSWSDFTPFSSCSVSCGGGFMTSNRTCLCGEVGDVGCEGTTTRQVPCAPEECPRFTQWTEFGSCSVQCGGGIRIRTRSCSRPGLCAPDEHGNILEQTLTCNTQQCVGRWGPFSEYGTCSVSCGGGTQSRTRKCLEGVCEGVATDMKRCNEVECPRSTSCNNENNVISDRSCCTWAEQNYCKIHKSYMQKNCAKACCEYQTDGTCVINTCYDLVPATSCEKFKDFCYDLSVQLYCRQSCGLC